MFWVRYMRRALLSAVGIDTQSRNYTSSFTMTLERAVGGNLGWDHDLSQCRKWDGEVYPDLPPAHTLPTLIEKWLRAKILGLGTNFHDNGPSRSWKLPVIPGTFHVRGVAAQLRSLEDVKQRIVMAAGTNKEFPEVTPPSGLMLMSGSHPLRYFIKQEVNSTLMLSLAHELQTQGVLPKELYLWTVGDPNQDASLAADDCERKIRAGANVIVTQPPLKNGSLEAFAKEIKSRNLHLQAKIVIGVPVFGSLKDVEFWGKLCRFHATEIDKLQKQLSTKESRATYTKQLVTKLERGKDELGIGGAHIMAPTRAAREEAILIFAEDS